MATLKMTKFEAVMVVTAIPRHRTYSTELNPSERDYLVLPGFRHASRSRSKPCERRPQPAFSQDSCGSSMGFMSGSSSTLLPVQNLRRAQRHHLKQPCRHCQSMAWLSGLARFSGETWSCVTAFSCDSGSPALVLYSRGPPATQEAVPVRSWYNSTSHLSMCVLQ